jgi:Putative DNA-binding domain
MYNPFGSVPIHELDATTLGALREVPEGWFIEYKKQPCTAKDYAKEVSAFANSHGGWMFIGLEENPSTHVPAGGPGIPSNQAARLLDSARDAITQNLSPAPHIELKFVEGPIPSLSVPPDHGVLVIGIPESKNTPHIHVTGKIYQRRVDAAQPTGITNRAELDELYARRQRRDRLVSDELNLGFDEVWTDAVTIPWLHLAFVPDEGSTNASAAVPLEKFRRAIRKEKTEGFRFHLGLPDVYTTALGCVARNMREQVDPSGAATTIEYSSSGAFYVTVGLSWASSGCAGSVDFLSNDQGTRFIELLRRHRYHETPVVDGTQLAILLMGLSERISFILEEFGESSRYCHRIKFRNMFRTIPFFDSKEYLDWCETHGLPIIHRGNFELPWGPENWFIVENENLRRFGLLGASFPHLLAAFGVSDEIAAEVVGQSGSSVIRKGVHGRE